MPLFRVTGKFANGHTFSVPTVDGSDAKDALGAVVSAPEIVSAGHGAVVMVAVRSLTGSKRRIRISTEPAKERKGGGRKKKTETEAPAATKTATRR